MVNQRNRRGTNPFAILGGVVAVVAMLLIALALALNTSTASTGARIDFAVNGTPIAQRAGVNLIQGTAVTITGVDGGIGSSIDYTINSAITGIVPILNGGTGSSTVTGARTNLNVDVSGTDNSINVTLAGTPDYITISGQVITRNLIDLTTDVIGDLLVTEGGTGVSSFINHGVLLGSDTSAISVTSAGLSGQVLTSNGSGSDPTFQATSSGGVNTSFASYRSQTSGYRYGLGITSSNLWSGSAFLSTNYRYVFPFATGNTAINTNEFWTLISTSSASSLLRFCIYDDLNSAPNNLIRDAGTIDVSTTGDKTLAFTNTVLDANSLYWFVFWSNGTPKLLTIPYGGVEVLGYINGGSSYIGYLSVLTFTTCPDPFGSFAKYSGIRMFWGGITEQ